MKALIDIRLLGRGAHSGIPYFTKELTSRLLTHSEDTYTLFYPGLRKQELPQQWRKHQNTSILDWRIPNKLLDGANRWFQGPNMSKRVPAEVIFSPHLNNLNKGSLPRVLTVHDLSFVHHPEFFSRRQRFLHYLQNWRKQIREADHLIAVSHYTREDLIKTLGVDSDKISVVYPGISSEFKPLDPHAQELRTFQKRHGLAAPYFLYLGALEARKNITQLVAAFDLLRTNPDCRGYELVLAGSPGHGSRAIAQAVARSRSRSSIRILSRVTDEERIFLYNGAVAFACTSFFEGFGFPALEAQACDIPVVASKRTSFIETLRDSALLVDPWKPSELADALTALALDGSLRARTIALGRENCKRFNWDTAAERVHSILKKTAHTLHG